MTGRILAGFAVLVAVVALAFGLKGCGDDSKPHKATCWRPAYAANPAATWAKHPSASHRHGEGPRGVNVCDPK